MTFDIDFEEWYQTGYWQDSYLPYSLVNEDQVVANVSVNLMQFMHQGTAKKMIQLGTVMTHPNYRGLGLSRLLIEQVLADYRNYGELLYLFANDSVLDFYPKFGFKEASEHCYTYSPIYSGKSSPMHKLDMTLKDSARTILRCYAYGNPLSAFYPLGNEGLLMFYATQGMRDHVYYLPEQDAVMIAKISGNKMTLYEIFCERELTPAHLSAIIPQGIEEVNLGFTPKEPTAMTCKLLKQEDTTLFVMGGNIFEGNPLMFPLLSHA